IKDYTNQFIKDLSKEIDEWGNKILKDIILKEGVDYLDANIAYEIDAIKGDFQRLDQQVRTNFSEQLNLSITGINDDFMGLGGIGGGLGVGGALAAGLMVFTGFGFIAVIIASVAATIASSFGLGILDIDGLNNQIKFKVLKIGLEKLDESIDKVSDKLQEIINTVFDSRIESASRVIEQAIALYENLLEQHSKAHQETLEHRNAKKQLIEQKRQQLEIFQNDLNILLNKCTV
ncbi:MAG: dynamin family protein, partial [Rhizonema sp. PD37]|nr:dynamin family protein [Rhizonema sp. PD37]